MNFIKYFKKNKLLCISIFIVSVFIVWLTVFVTQNCLFFKDDLWQGVYNTYDEKITDTFTIRSWFYMHGGGYLCLFLTRFFNMGLPIILGIHPSDFIGYGTGLVKGILFVALLIQYCKLGTRSINSKLLFFSLFVFLASYTYYTCFYCLSDILIVNDIFFRYVLPLLFLNPFLDFLSNQTQNNNKITIGYLLLVCFYAFALASSVENVFYALVLIYMMMFCYNLLPLPSQYKLNIDRNIVIPGFIIYYVIAAYMMSPGFHCMAVSRGLTEINITFDTIFDFTSTYWKILILDNLMYWILFIIVLALTIYFAKKNNEWKKILIPVMWQVSFLGVMYSLIFCGRTFYANTYWLSSINLRNAFKFVILYTILVLANYVINQILTLIKNIDMKKYFINIISILLLLSSIPLILYCKNNIYHFSEFKNAKTQTYIAEKMLRFYYLKKQTPHLPQQLTRSLKGNMMSFIFEDKFDRYMEETECSTHSLFSMSYYPKIYKDPFSIDRGYCFSDSAIDNYYKDGGVFTKKELETVRFYRLYDADYVLNKTPQEEIYSSDEVYNIIEKAKLRMPS